MPITSEQATFNRNELTGNIGTLIYMCPEMISNSVYTEKCDVYSFGSMMYEVFFEKIPYFDSNTFEEIRGKVKLGKLPKYDKEATYTRFERQYIALMEQCWSKNPALRPSFVEVLKRLEERNCIKNLKYTRWKHDVTICSIKSLY